MLTTPHIMERLSLAYIHAISARAGINIATREEHDYGVDIQLSTITWLGRKRIDAGFPIHVQMKSTIVWTMEEDSIVYDMEVDAYNMMATRHEAAIPYYIFLLCLPYESAEWLTHDENNLILKNCCYWVRERGAASGNGSKKRVRFPRSQSVNVESLTGLLDAARRDLLP